MTYEMAIPTMNRTTPARITVRFIYGVVFEFWVGAPANVWKDLSWSPCRLVVDCGNVQPHSPGVNLEDALANTDVDRTLLGAGGAGTR